MSPETPFSDWTRHRSEILNRKQSWIKPINTSSDVNKAHIQHCEIEFVVVKEELANK